MPQSQIDAAASCGIIVTILACGRLSLVADSGQMIANTCDEALDYIQFIANIDN